MEGIVDDAGRIDHPYRNFIGVSRYARWRDADSRRETWVESVDRYVDFMVDHLETNVGYTPPSDEVTRVRNFILNHQSLPSMRALMTAGPALERNNIAGYNCSYVVVDDPIALDEILYILMNGTGVGFSAEWKYTSQLPPVPRSFDVRPGCVIKVDDSKEGWAYAFRELLAYLWDGVIPSWDVSEVRPAGSRLMTFGGRASGPGPLEELFRFTVKQFTLAGGRQLRPLEVHDIVCKVASVVVVGGVRRAALISLGDLSDPYMRDAKHGEWWVKNNQRALANNSAVYEGRPTREVFDAEWKALVASGSGERGIFNRAAARTQAAKNGRRDPSFDFGTNPCSEIILRPNQFCNLSTVVVQGEDNLNDLEEKVEVATILGTWQSTLTYFKYLRPLWKENTEVERLLGVSMTGAFGNKLLNFGISKEVTENVLDHLREWAVKTNARLADAMGIPRSAAITCVKPEGTTSQLTLTSSGIHAWHAEWYLRTVRGDMKDPMTQFMIDSGFYWEPDLMNPDHTAVFYFPIAAPEGAITRHELTAIQHLELWLTYQRHWCEHKPSVTISVRAEEWEEVGEWVWEHFDELSGVSFLPLTEHTYQQAPYQDITRDEYHEWVERIPTQVNWEMLSAYELEDSTTSTQALACTAGACDVVDIGNTEKVEQVA
jgi:ribonucleoside-triphosphate reductase (thioredoxin)